MIALDAWLWTAAPKNQGGFAFIVVTLCISISVLIFPLLTRTAGRDVTVDNAGILLAAYNETDSRFDNLPFANIGTIELVQGRFEGTIYPMLKIEHHLEDAPLYVGLPLSFNIGALEAHLLQCGMALEATGDVVDFDAAQAAALSDPPAGPEMPALEETEEPRSSVSYDRNFVQGTLLLKWTEAPNVRREIDKIERTPEERRKLRRDWALASLLIGFAFGTIMQVVLFFIAKPKAPAPAWMPLATWLGMSLAMGGFMYLMGRVMDLGTPRIVHLMDNCIYVAQATGNALEPPTPLFWIAYEKAAAWKIHHVTIGKEKHPVLHLIPHLGKPVLLGLDGTANLAEIEEILNECIK